MFTFDAADDTGQGHVDRGGEESGRDDEEDGLEDVEDDAVGVGVCGGARGVADSFACKGNVLEDYERRWGKEMYRDSRWRAKCKNSFFVCKCARIGDSR